MLELIGPRLCRPMCGKALPFRLLYLEFSGGYASLSDGGLASSIFKLRLTERRSLSPPQMAEPLNELSI